MVLHRNRYEYQWNRIEDPDMNPHNYAHVISTKLPKTASSANVAGKSGCLPAKN
jgi:hypothetical protein